MLFWRINLLACCLVLAFMSLMTVLYWFIDKVWTLNKVEYNIQAGKSPQPGSNWRITALHIYPGNTLAALDLLDRELLYFGPYCSTPTYLIRSQSPRSATGPWYTAAGWVESFWKNVYFIIQLATADGIRALSRQTRHVLLCDISCLQAEKSTECIAIGDGVSLVGRAAVSTERKMPYNQPQPSRWYFWTFSIAWTCP